MFMSSPKQIRLTRRQILLMAGSAFVGMMLSTVATLAVTIPLVSSQARPMFSDQQVRELAALTAAKPVSYVAPTNTRQASVINSQQADEPQGSVGNCTGPGQEGQGPEAASAAEPQPSDMSMPSEAEASPHGHFINAPKRFEQTNINEHIINNDNSVHNSTAFYQDSNNVVAINSGNTASFNQNSLNKTDNNVTLANQGDHNKVYMNADVSNASESSMNNAVENTQSANFATDVHQYGKTEQANVNLHPVVTGGADPASADSSSAEQPADNTVSNDTVTQPGTTTAPGQQTPAGNPAADNTAGQTDTTVPTSQTL
jgi:hypothetical protein